MSTQIGSLAVAGRSDGQVVHVKLEGDADLRDSTALAEALMGWHQTAVTAGAKEVRVDVRGVDFMNSTALGAFVEWIGALLKLQPPQRYRIHFEAISTRRWQRSSLHSLASFAPEHVVVSYL